MQVQPTCLYLFHALSHECHRSSSWNSARRWLAHGMDSSHGTGATHPALSWASLFSCALLPRENIFSICIYHAQILLFMYLLPSSPKSCSDPNNLEDRTKNVVIIWPTCTTENMHRAHMGALPWSYQQISVYLTEPEPMMFKIRWGKGSELRSFFSCPSITCQNKAFNLKSNWMVFSSMPRKTCRTSAHS